MKDEIKLFLAQDEHGFVWICKQTPLDSATDIGGEFLVQLLPTQKTHPEEYIAIVEALSHLFTEPAIADGEKNKDPELGPVKKKSGKKGGFLI